MNNMRYKLIVMGLALSVGSAYAAAATPAKELTQLLEKMKSFQAHFSQKIKSSTGEKISNTTGEVIIQRPNRFYWKSLRPDPILVIADGKFLWTYDVDLAQATKQNLKKALKNSPAALLAGSVDKFEHDFVIEKAQANDCKTAKNQCFSLKPKQKDTTFKNIVIGFTQDKLVEIRMSDPLGQAIYTVFSDVKTNGAIKPDLFNFVPPKGVDVIRYD